MKAQNIQQRIKALEMSLYYKAGVSRQIVQLELNGLKGKLKTTGNNNRTKIEKEYKK